MLTALLSLVAGAALGALVVYVFWVRDRQSLVEVVARSEAERDAAVRSDAQQRALLADNQIQLRDAFSALSRSALKENRDDFLGNAQTVLEPMKDALEKVQRHLHDVDKAREGSFRAVASELNLLRGAQDQLRASADGLSRSLGSPNVRGAWGEIQLRRIVELAGMLAAVRFRRESQRGVRCRQPADTGPRGAAAGRRHDRGRREGSHSGLSHGGQREGRCDARSSLWTRTPGSFAITSDRSARRNTGSSFSRRRSSW